MRNTSFWVLIILLTTGIGANKGNAQSRSWDAGAIGGIGFVRVNGNPLLSSFLESDSRPCFGPAVRVELNKRYSVRSHLAYESKGAKGFLPLYDDEGEPLGLFQTQINYDYLTLPVLIEAAWGGKLKFTLSMGPYLGIMLSQKTTYTDLFSGDVLKDTDMSKYVPWDGGWITGSGLRLQAGKRTIITLDGRLNFGLANVASKPVFYSLELHQQSSQILLGIHFRPKSMSRRRP